MDQELIDKIMQSSVFIPAEWVTQDKVKSGEAYAYTQGIMNGINQAIKVIKDQND